MKTLRTLTGLTGLLFLLAGCGGSDTTETPQPEPEAEAPAPETPDTPEITPEDLAGAENVALVPSPVETQKALESAGIDTQLSGLIPDHAFDFEKSDVDHAAVRTGVVLADTLLTIKSAEKDALLSRITSIQKGMSQLGGGGDIDSMLRDMAERVKNDAVTRDELLKEFDEMSGAVIPELEFNGNERVVPLIEAGSWLEGANLVAQAVKGKGEPGAADSLLKQPAVVDYFINYVKSEGAVKASDIVAKQLEASLATLKALADKEGALTGEDIETVIKVTGDVLALL